MGYEKRYTTLLFEMLEKIHASETQSCELHKNPRLRCGVDPIYLLLAC